MEYRIYRHQEGIGLNGKEFVMDKKEIMLFNTVNDAKKPLKNLMMDLVSQLFMRQ